ncbi:MAG: ABC transporter ATP-binding protein [Methanomassiliicoccales archaeon]|nr:ABC transporter ATP-binding protein [Methanomassiliicoccales archaeon]
MVKDLHKKFGDQVALDGVGFEVEEGEFFGLLGPNGAGKTTTIRMITGVLKPDRGSVTVQGIDLRKAPLQAKQNMGVIPEVGNVYPDLSAIENLDLVGRFYGLDKTTRRSRAERLLVDLGLSERKDDLLRKFSKGMRQRVSIACAMVNEPPVLLLDEPTEGLDVMSRRLIVEKVRELNKKGTSVLMTTHNIEEANRLCQRVCIINKGKVVAFDTPERLRKTVEKIQTIEVAFDRRIDPGILEGSNISKVEACGDKWRIYTEDPDKALETILAVKEREGLRVLSIATCGPSLEDVFVKICEVPR